jgi:hypothetical protein
MQGGSKQTKTGPKGRSAMNRHPAGSEGGLIGDPH